MPNSEKWPSDENDIAPREFLEAFGQIALAYNYLESMLRSRFIAVAPLGEEQAKILFGSLSNRERADLLAALVDNNEKDAETKSVLKACVLHYNICTDNRNILLHAILKDLDANVVKLQKQASQDPRRDVEFHVPLSDIRLVADQMAETVRFIFSAVIFLAFRGSPASLAGHYALPEIPPKPRKLTPYLPAEVPAAGTLRH